MSNWHKPLALISFVAALGCSAIAGEHAAGFYGYGARPTDAEIAGWAIAVRGDGKGLPVGHGSVQEGTDVYANACAMCHGTFGEGEGRFPKLAGTGSLTGDRPEPMVGNYWPYAPTLFDYINRAMPFPAPHSLPPNDVYAVVAYVLNMNNVVPDDFVADEKTLPKVQMPNRNGFTWTDPRPDTHDVACMHDCRKVEDIKITSTAEDNHLTPRTTGSLDKELPK